jgi:hypothetical protein
MLDAPMRGQALSFHIMGCGFHSAQQQRYQAKIEK